MLREKSQVYPREYDKKLHLGSTLGQGGTRNGREPESDPSKDSEHSSHRENIVEVRHDVICIMQGDIQGAISQDDASKAPHREKEKEA